MTYSTSDRRRFLSAVAATMASLASRTSHADESRRQSTDLLDSRLREFLWNSQRDDGRWASDTYAVLGGGQALTPFVLFALLESDPSLHESAGAKRALQWMETQLRKGVLGVADDDVMEYPVFATAFGLRCFHRMRQDDVTSPTELMRRHLIRQQFAEPGLFGPESLAYGGWGFGGTRPPGKTGHMDLSHVRWVLAALAETKNTDRPEYESKAQRFLRLMQKSVDEDRPQPLGDGTIARHARFDGGFYFSPIVLAANKGRIQRDGDRAYFRSYATATCDGVLALLDSGVDHDDRRIVAAKKWLQRNSDWEYPAGIPAEHPEPWGDAVFFYHQAVRAEVYNRLGIDGGWRRLLLSRLSKHLQPNGSIYNQRCGLMKEDDPIMCSALALIAISHARATKG